MLIINLCVTHKPRDGCLKFKNTVALFAAQQLIIAKVTPMLQLFKYVGRDQKGHKISGSLKANDTGEVASYLTKRHIIPIDIKKNEKSYEKILRDIENILQRGIIPLPELLNFCREMAALTDVGISILDAIKQLSLTSSSRLFADVLSNIAEDLAAGKTLANALRKYPKIFTVIFCNIVEVGENTGDLNESFKQLCNYLENMINNRRRIAATTRYPTTVMIAAVTASIVINMVVIPKFTQMFQHFSIKLPLPTRILIAFSNFLIAHWQILLTALLAIIISIPYLLAKPKIRAKWDKYKLKIPIFGKIQMRIMISQFMWTFSLILRSGIEIIKGITLAGNSSGNVYFMQQIFVMREGLEKGENLSVSASKINLFTPAILQMIAVGEESGRLDDILQSINLYYEREIDYDIKRINELIEPLLLAMVGVMVLFLALGVYLPMWELVKSINF